MSRHRHTRRGQQGSALILVVFILVAMLGLGVLAMRTATENIAGSGNLRMSIQAKYVSEMGLYHAVTLMNRQGATLLPIRDNPSFEGGIIEVESALPDSPDVSLVKYTDSNGVVRQSKRMPAPSFLSDAPNPLGVAGAASGMVPSYRVKVSGFQPWACPEGTDEESLRQSGQGCCLIHFESRGMIAETPLPSEETMDSELASNLYAEHAMRAGIVVGPMSLKGCQR